MVNKDLCSERGSRIAFRCFLLAGDAGKRSGWMRGLRLDRILAGTALGIVLATSAFAQSGQPDGSAPGLEARVPVPQPADVKPPTRDDVDGGKSEARLGAEALPSLSAETSAGASVAVKRSGAHEPESAQAAPAYAPDTESMVTGAVTEHAPPSAELSSPPAPEPEQGRDAAAPKDGTAAAPKDGTKDGAAPVESGKAAPENAPTEAAHAPADTPANAGSATKDTAAPASQETAKAPTEPAKDSGKDAAPVPAKEGTETATKDVGKDAAGQATKDAGKEAKPIAANLAPADVAVAEKLRDMLGAKIDRIFERKNERTAVSAFYTARGFAPLWLDNAAANERSKAAVARLKGAEADGLNPADYPVPDFAAAAGRPDALAEAELKLSAAVVTYARHAQSGRVHFSRVSADIEFNLAVPDPAEVLGRMAQAKDAGEALGSYNPPQPGYQALRAKLAEMRGHNGEVGPTRIPPGPVIKLGMHDERVPQLRERLGVTGEASNTTYDKPLAEAVKNFQREHELAASGNFTAGTLEALNGPRREHVTDTIIANMERWRWLPRELGDAYVMVNLPDYTLRVMQNGSMIWHTRIVVGKPTTPTPLLSEPMRYITINPTWNVPPSIVYKEYLPVLQQDPGALARIGLRVEYGRDGVHISQPPGERNALGRIRFNFPNKFLVYQHDTPDKYLFGKEKRAYSHGCMRVQDPAKYAEVLLSIGAPRQGYTVERLQRMFGSEERDINLTPMIPVHVTYQTAFVDDAGRLEFRDDIYGRDSQVLAALKGENLRVADIPVERRGTRHQAVRVPPRTFPFGSPYQNNAFPFFGFFR
jgi:murein L,D-transpeptidase YcbB/YkuD